MSWFDDVDPTEDEILDRWCDAGIVVLCALLGLIITSRLTGG